MTDWGHFEETAGRDRSAACVVCEAMLPDAVGGALTEAEQGALDKHLAGCVDCAQEFAEAQRGAAWLGLLKQQAPEPGTALLERILAQTTLAPSSLDQAALAQVPLAQTTGSAAAAEPSSFAGLPRLRAAVAPPVPFPATGTRIAAQALPARSLPAQSRAIRFVHARSWGSRAAAHWTSAWSSVRSALSIHGLLQPRLAMTAAMLFFSVALTLNLTGVRVSEFRAGLLSPSGLRRSLADRSSAAVRTFQNSSVVFQMESRVSDLRSDWDAGESGRSGESRQSDGSSPSEPASSGSEGGTRPHQSAKPFGSSRLRSAPTVGAVAMLDAPGEGI